MNVSQHAYEVVNGFRISLSPEQKAMLGDEDYENLQILIEAAIAAHASKVLHDNAKLIEALAKQTRHLAASIEQDEPYQKNTKM